MTIQLSFHSFSACTIPGLEQQPELYVWVSVCDVIIRKCTSPYLLNYATRDNYMQHGQDLLSRIEMENCLSHFSGVSWSRREIFKKPSLQEIQRGNVRVVNLLNPAQTGFFNIDRIDLSSMALGSFQTRQGKAGQTTSV